MSAIHSVKSHPTQAQQLATPQPAQAKAAQSSAPVASTQDSVSISPAAAKAAQGQVTPAAQPADFPTYKAPGTR